MSRGRVWSNDPNEPLRLLPALPFLDQLPLPMVAVGIHGVLTYANEACAEMLGHGDAGSLIGVSLSTLLPEHSHRAGSECLAALRNANGAIVQWLHADSCPIPTVVSQPLPLLSRRPQLLIAITDMTARLWHTGSKALPPTFVPRPSHDDDTPEPIVA